MEVNQGKYREEHGSSRTHRVTRYYQKLTLTLGT